jgi:hypothetical protein
MPPYCPNCSASLPSLEAAKCENCDAVFTHPNGWAPVSRPPGLFVARTKAPDIEAESANYPESVPLGLLLLLTGFASLCLGLLISGWALLPAFVCIGLSYVVMTSKSVKVQIFAIGTVIAGLVLAWLLFSFLRAAVFSR